ncbi:FliM/FliN family flagellar motor switch protein [Novosphingobium colocasiae]|uniref:FliM/FliN family flagellar motor switch protein n=1 Tax=Novosphingobium colocasiae TaxID=1256513 RepID=UPI0035B11282
MMKLDHPLIAERAVARHCQELLGSGPGIAELVPALSLIGERLTRALAAGLARLSGARPPVVSAGMPMDTTLGAIQAELDTLAMHSLLALGPDGHPALATFAAAPVFRLVDRAFGGKGEVPDPLPDAFPLSAELLLGRIEATLAEALGTALGGAQPLRVVPRRRETSLRQLDPFAMNADLLQLAIEVEEEGAAPWSLTIAFPIATLAAVATVPRHPGRGVRREGPADPAAEPYASLPLSVSAVVIDMRLDFARVAALSAGDVIPVAIARAVPLRVGGRTVATGTVGEVEDRVAIQIGHAF